MNKIIVLLATSFVLSACGANPTAANAVPDDASGDVTGATAANNESGLGTIAYNGNTRTKPCKKRRRTGSHLYTNGCSDPDSGSRPVREGDWNSLGRYVVTGGGPRNE
jgi:hypothetical protein